VKKKIEKLSSTLHELDNKPQNKHAYFAEDREEAKEIQSRIGQSSNMTDPLFLLFMESHFYCLLVSTFIFVSI